jgi:pilus assembly protein CpaF
VNSFDLSVTDDNGTHFAFALEHFPCRVGRGKNCDVELPGWRVGRVHAVIEQSNKVLRLVDQGTLNGTWVNGQRIVEYAPLDETDEILIGGLSAATKTSQG